MAYPMNVAEFDLRFFTGKNTWLTLAVDDTGHCIDCIVTYMEEGFPPEHTTFSDQPNPKQALAFMFYKLYEVLDKKEEG